MFTCPDRVDGKPGKVFDPLMNDQDWALAFYLVIFSPSRDCTQSGIISAFLQRLYPIGCNDTKTIEIIPERVLP